MKLRVLFVDDEQRILDGMRRMLRPMRKEWETEFADSGERALEILEQRPFDVVVSDMRMPGMDGSQLLRQVQRLHPETVRIILSGHSDIELVLASVGPSHQYLTKPCDPEELKQTIAGAMALRDLLEEENLRAVVGGLDHLPSVPHLFTEIVEELQSDDASLGRIGEIVGQDVAMTAQVLRLVNSAYFGLRQTITSPERAVSYLGIGALSSLVLGHEVFREADDDLLARFGLGELWTHSADVAALARRIVELEGGDTLVRDDAFTAGLLHDVGKIILAKNYPERYAAVLEAAGEEGVSLEAAERDGFQACHGGIGAYLMSVWGLPNSVIEAIAYHHCPSESRSSGFRPLTAVHAANALLRSAGGPGPEGQGQEGEEPSRGGAGQLDRAYLDTLGLSQRVNIWAGECPARAGTRVGV